MSTDDWTPPGWKIEEDEPHPEDGWRAVRLECLAEGCSHWNYTGLPKDVPTANLLATRSAHDHQEQHRPGRAFDIEVDWIVSACCSVCEDEIGKVEDDGEGLVCRECGTTWDRDGSDGYRADT